VKKSSVAQLSPESSSEKIIVAIDTSCDDTSAAVTAGWRVLSNVIASQTQLHKQYGGVFPTVAKQAHKENIAPTVVAALKRAGVTWQDIDAIAVTQGPGLAPALEVGINYAKEMAELHTVPLIPVNHLEGHLLSVLAVPKTKLSKTQVANAPVFPILSLIISGGHSEFLLVHDFGKYERIGATIDDAAGEALDKIGRMLDLGYPAAPIIEIFAKKGNPKAHIFPLPMTTSGDYNLSFSGIKTFARNLIASLEAEGKLTSQQAIFDLSASVQYSVFRHITHKLRKILIDHPEITEIWLGGGVAANMNLRAAIRATAKNARTQLQKSSTPSNVKTLKLRTPYTKRLCQDNAAMIGVAAQFGKSTETFDRNPNLKLNSD